MAGQTLGGLCSDGLMGNMVLPFRGDGEVETITITARSFWICRITRPNIRPHLITRRQNLKLLELWAATPEDPSNPCI